MPKSGNKTRGADVVFNCRHCEQVLPSSKFQSNNKLEAGLNVWCNDCMDYLNQQRELGTYLAGELQKAYSKDYQRSYHRRRRMMLGGKKKKVLEGTQRLTKQVLRNNLPEKFGFSTLKREQVQRELVRLLDTLKETPTWINFEDEMISESHLENFEGRLQIVRVLPMELYPELALVRGNCEVQVRSGERVVKRATFQFTREQVNEGFELLAKCVVEARYYA